MDATVKSDLYLLKDGTASDDYATRRLACSNLFYVKQEKRGWLRPCYRLSFNTEGSRLNPGFLIPKRYYRLDEGPGTSPQYFRLLAYHFTEDQLIIDATLL